MTEWQEVDLKFRQVMRENPEADEGVIRKQVEGVVKAERRARAEAVGICLGDLSPEFEAATSKASLPVQVSKPITLAELMSAGLLTKGGEVMEAMSKMNLYELHLRPEDAALLLPALDSYYPATASQNPEGVALLRKALEGCAAFVPVDLAGDKVWSGLTMRLACAYQRQSQTVVRARSKAAAVRMLSEAGDTISAHHFSQYWSETRNTEHLAVVKEPGVWVKESETWVKK